MYDKRQQNTTHFDSLLEGVTAMHKFRIPQKSLQKLLEMDVFKYLNFQHLPFYILIMFHYNII